jgi:NIMA (never in mitosis gene a)-related kinase 1/4/5
MEYADGGDLHTRIKQLKEAKKFFSEDDILNIFTQISLAIKHLHDRKILHRDLKSQNIFLTKNNIVKLGDFGIAKVLSHTKENVQTIVGTPYYLSPEIVENKPYNHKSDIWSLGILLYEMAALEPPFNGSSLHMLAMRIVRANYTPIPKRYSSKLATLIKKLLNPNTNERPSINKILKFDIISKRAQELMDEEEYIQEFSHTVLHNKNVFKQVNVSKDDVNGDIGEEETMFTPPKQASAKAEHRKIEKTESEKHHKLPEMSETALYEQDPLAYVNDVIGDLKEKHILDQTGDIKPMKKAPSANVQDRPRKKLKAEPQNQTKKTSQWEIREQLAQK